MRIGAPNQFLMLRNCSVKWRSSERSVSSSRSVTRGCVTAPPMAAAIIAARTRDLASIFAAEQHSEQALHEVLKRLVVAE